MRWRFSSLSFGTRRRAGRRSTGRWLTDHLDKCRSQRCSSSSIPSTRCICTFRCSCPSNSRRRCRSTKILRNIYPCRSRCAQSTVGKDSCRRWNQSLRTQHSFGTCNLLEWSSTCPHRSRCAPNSPWRSNPKSTFGHCRTNCQTCRRTHRLSSDCPVRSNYRWSNGD